MSETPTYARTDELRPGDRVWHPFDIVCFTVAHEPKPETGLHFQGEPGLRVTGTNDRGETVHVDVAPGYEWLRGPIRDAETAVRELGALPVGTEPQVAPKQRAAIAELIGDTKPATDHLLLEMAQQIRDRREHDHSTVADWDWYCLNASGWLGDKAPMVLRRLLDAEARVAELETEVVQGRAYADQVVAKLETQVKAARAVHVKFPDSEHCQHDAEPWPCPTVAALGEDPCHPCGCPKRFDRHAWGCPAQAAEAGGGS